MAKNVPKYLIIHHTGGSDSNPLADSSNFTFEQCNEQHEKSFNFISSLGYYVGYQYYISKDGVVKQARADDEEGAHTIGYNTQSIGICLAGNFDSTLPTEAQKYTLANLMTVLTHQYSIPISNVVPHRKFAVKTCYGKKLSDTWAQDLITPMVAPVTPILSREEKIRKAAALLSEAMELLKGLN